MHGGDHAPMRGFANMPRILTVLGSAASTSTNQLVETVEVLAGGHLA